MDELIKQLQAKTGISDDMAKQVADFIKNNMHEIPKWLGDGALGGLADKAGGMLGGLGGMLGGDKKD